MPFRFQHFTKRVLQTMVVLCFSFPAISQTCGSFVRVSSSAISYHTAAIKTDGTLWTWGTNPSGQLGNGTNFSSYSPVLVGSATNWLSTATGGRHTMAIKTDSTLWTWGENSLGQLGDGTLINRSIPAQITPGMKWLAVCGGQNYTVALRADGTLWAWGNNSSGELGDGTNTSRSAPVQIGTDNNWAKIATGVTHTMAIKTDGSLWGWGSNNFGNLGDGTTTNRNSPVPIAAGSTWKAIACGQLFSMGIKTDGTLWGWGANGLLGNGLNISVASPVQAGTASNWESVSCGAFHSLGLKSDGSLWAWGINDVGQLGDGSFTNRLSPVPIGSGTSWTVVSTGASHSLAINADGSLFSWGGNIVGSLGNGTTVTSNLPGAVSTNQDITIAMANTQQTLPVILSTTFFNGATCTNLIATVAPAGAAPVYGTTTSRVWIENTSSAGFVKRHYEIAPQNNANSATGTVTLYFTQAEFDAYNALNTVKLPTGPADENGKANLRIENRKGNSTDNSGLPYTYSGGASFIDPPDDKIIWNSFQSRWEISFLVTGFGGFFVNTSGSLNFSLCGGAIHTITASSTGISYQWQADEGASFADIANGTFYSGVNSSVLMITGLSSAQTGIRYRCVVNGVPGPEYIVRFELRWSGNSGTDWFTGSNWFGCGAVPDSKTNVVIPAGRTNYPLINAATTIRSLTNEPGASVTVQSGAVLSIIR